METTERQPSCTASLTRIWRSALHNEPIDPANWDGDQAAVFGLGLGMQEVLQQLYGQRPPLDAFLAWADSHRSSTVKQNGSVQDTLSDADLSHWKEHGYVVIRNAVDDQQRRAAANAIWDFLDASPADPESWYRPHPAKNGLMLVLTQHPALAAVRSSARIRRAFVQLYGTEAIYPVVDKVSFNPPETAQYRFAGSPLHWDTSLVQPVPLRLQGLLYLSDTSAGDGAFQCVPGFQHRIGQWLESLPPGCDPRMHAPETLTPIDIEGSAGDFIIWHSALPHCATPNRGRSPRLVQYLTYLPEGFKDSRPWL
ncbi:MAG: phytanoyl-CoA dioxygenase [Sphingobacteriales bacterium]|nr:MAG: phytanoyl-CoA dioxygenase [Sphingobacteriales bacterium]